jgi:ABC-type phosphate/phosphonate transport system substrate-binding protein
MRASLPMYDFPELAAASAGWWAGLRRHFEAQGVKALPDALTLGVDPIAQWDGPALIFSQTCGYPMTHALAGKVRLLATPRYAAPGCAGPTYVSWIVVRRDDPAERFAELRGRRPAFNGRDSQSGYNVLRALAAPLATEGRFFGSAAIESGAHRKSLAMVAGGQADLAAIDCVSFALIARVAPKEVAGLRVLCASAPAPALPYVTAASTDDATIRQLQAGLFAACADLALADVRRALLIEGCEILPPSCYEVILEIERSAVAQGYPELG